MDLILLLRTYSWGIGGDIVLIHKFFKYYYGGMHIAVLCSKKWSYHALKRNLPWRYAIGCGPVGAVLKKRCKRPPFAAQ